MTPRKAVLALAATLTALGLVATPANAATSTPRVLTLIGSGATLGIADLNAPGPTPGDVRTLSLSLKNLKGQPAGRAEIVQTLNRQEGGTGTAVKVVVLNLPRGVITATGLTEFTDITDRQARPNDRTERIAITGGTGIYRRAAGHIDIEVLPDFASRWVISLDSTS
jgi:hypothetical protein